MICFGSNHLFTVSAVLGRQPHLLPSLVAWDGLATVGDHRVLMHSAYLATRTPRTEDGRCRLTLQSSADRLRRQLTSNVSPHENLRRS